MDRRKITSALNGKKSNGPVSREGKYWSSKNALKHGLRSADWHLTIGENKKEYEDFIIEGLKHYRPFDFYTREIFERMMHQLWKLKLIPKIESGIAAYEMQTYEAEDYKTKRAELIQHADFEEQDQQKVKYQNLLLGIAFLKDANSGNAFLKLSNYETKLLSNFFQLEKIYLNYKEKKHGRKNKQH